MSTETPPVPPVDERRLAAIMFTDVSGYSARVQVDEVGTLALVRADMDRMREISAQFGGDVLATMGDGMLICFSSTVRAVSCALQIQSEFGLRKETLPPEKCLDHRIGIHLGDIFVRDGNVAGDGVNIAARLQTKAPPGGICISQTVHDTVKGKLAMHSVFIGPQSFKNIREPIPIYHLSPQGDEPPDALPPAAASTAGRSWMRSPVTWLLAAAAAGIGVAVIPKLLPSKAPAPAVTEVSAPAPAPAPSQPKLAESKPAAAKSVSAMPAAQQASVPTAPATLASAGAPPSTGPAVAPPPPSATPTPAAPAMDAAAQHQAVVKALSFFQGGGGKKEDFAIAEDLIKKAIAADPTNAEAWTAQAQLDFAYLRTGFDRSKARVDDTQSAAERAAKLAPDSAAALLVLGHSERMRGGDAKDAEKTFTAALRLAPNNSEALLGLADSLRAQGRLDEAATVMKKAVALPGTPLPARLDQAAILFNLRRFGEADSVLRELQTGRVLPPAWLARAEIEVTWKGDTDAAEKSLGQFPAASRGEDLAAFLNIYVELLARKPAAALALLKAYPRPFFSNTLFTGPKAWLAGLAHVQLKQAGDASKDWEGGLADVRARLQAAPNNQTFQALQGLLLAESGRTADALRLARLLAHRPLREGLAPSWCEDPALIFCVCGRPTEAIARIENLLAGPSAWPLTPALLRLDPVWDPIRENPRFQKLATGDLLK